MGRTTQEQLHLYVSKTQVQLLKDAARATRRTQQSLLREGLEWVLMRYGGKAKEGKRDE